MSWRHNILGAKRQWKNVVSSRRIRNTLGWDNISKDVQILGTYLSPGEKLLWFWRYLWFLQETASMDAKEAMTNIMGDLSQLLIKTTMPTAVTVLGTGRAGTGTIGVAAILWTVDTVGRLEDNVMPAICGMKVMDTSGWINQWWWYVETKSLA